jgi:hypothetical protein
MPIRSLGVATGIVLLQWVVATALIGFSLRALVLGGLAAGLVVAVGTAAGGRVSGALAGLFYVIAPSILSFWRADFRPQWRDELLPVLYGAEQPARILSGIVLLAGVLAFARLPRVQGLVAAVVAGLVAAALVRVDQASWSFVWSELGTSLSRVREVGWSVRVVEYLPIAGAVGLGLRRPALLLPLLVGFIAAVLYPLGNDRGTLLPDAIAIVPGLPLYAVLVGCLTLLVPRPVASSSSSAVSSRARRWARITF